jgi:hypothetical protein
LILAPDNASIAAAQPLAGMTPSLFPAAEPPRKPEIAASFWLLASSNLFVC